MDSFAASTAGRSLNCYQPARHHMTYHDGTTVRLGDVVRVPVPGGSAKARVVMLGETYEHLPDIDASFVAWVKKDQVLERKSIVVEWLDVNPLAHDDPRYAAVGNYMFSELDEWVTPA
jgi:hypothetical protein